MTNLATCIEQQLKPLIGLRLSIARRAVDMRAFHFGDIQSDGEGTFGTYALHIQCAWRIEKTDRILTGRSDLWEPVETGSDFDWASWHYDKSENIQDHVIGSLLQGHDSKTHSAVNTTSQLIVEQVEADIYGSVKISLSGGFCLRIFPEGSTGEDWRFFEPGNLDSHFVIVGGKVNI